MVLRPAVFALTLRTRTSTTPTRLRRRSLGARKAENWFIEWAQVKVERLRRRRGREEGGEEDASLTPSSVPHSLARSSARKETQMRATKGERAANKRGAILPRLRQRHSSHPTPPPLRNRTTAPRISRRTRRVRQSTGRGVA